MGNERTQQRRIAATVRTKRSSKQAAPAPADHGLLALQRSVGNAAVVDLLRRQEQEQGEPTAPQEGDGAIGEVVAEGTVDKIEGEPIIDHDRVSARRPSVRNVRNGRAINVTDDDRHGETSSSMGYDDTSWRV